MNNAKILIIEDNEDLVFSLTKVLKNEGYQVISAESGEEGLEILQKDLIDLILLDLNLPKMNGLEILSTVKANDPDMVVLMMTASTGVQPAIEALKKGAFEYLMKPFELDELKVVVKNALETHQLKLEVNRLKRAHQKQHPSDNIFGESNAIQKTRELINVIAQTPRTSVLIQGDSGTGKELVANAIHYGSARNNKPFIKINCSAIPDNLIESELFGHEKGSFTDAKTLKKGLFELANGGTIFLDEIASMKLSLQPKILRLIESQTFRRIGGVNDIHVDVRIIAATNVDLGEMVENKEFREDLFYRLKVMEVTIPPLRERERDILLIAKLFLQEFNCEFNKNVNGFSEETEKLMLVYDWPGNVRELKNVIERGVILCQEDMIQPEHLPIELRQGSEPHISEKPSFGNIPLQEMEKYHILQVLGSVNGNKSQASRILDISRSTLREKLKSYNITE